MRHASLVVILGFLSAAAACDGFTRAGSGSGSGGAGGFHGSDGGPSGSGGLAGTGGALGTGGIAGTGGASGTGGAAGAGGSGAGGAAIPTNYGNCTNGLACSSGQTCAFDCQGNSGSAALNGSPAIRCSCVNGALACTFMYEGTAGSMPPTCSGVIKFSQCSSACRFCASQGSSGGCFCDMRGTWICT